MPFGIIPLCIYLRHCQGVCTGISFIDSTPLAICHTRCRHQHRLFAGQAQWSKSSTGWFFSFKLHMLRPIFITTLTTITGFFPLLLQGDQGDIWYTLALGTSGV